MKMLKTVISACALICLLTNANATLYAQTVSSTPPAASSSDELLLVEALERAQAEVVEGRKTVKVFKKVVADLEDQVQTEKKNGRQATENYRLKVSELGETRLALDAAKRELGVHESRVKALEKQLKAARRENTLLRVGLVAVISAALYALLSR